MKFATNLTAAVVVVVVVIVIIPLWPLNGGAVEMNGDRVPYRELRVVEQTSSVNFKSSQFGFGNGPTQRYYQSLSRPPGDVPYFSIELSSITLSNNSRVLVTIEDTQSGRPLQTWGEQVLRRNTALLSEPLYARNVTIRVAAESPVKLAFSAVLMIPKLSMNTVTPAAVGPDLTLYDGLPPAPPSKLQGYSRSVAKLHIGAEAATCTGFLIQDDLVLTAFHCMEYSSAFNRSRNSATPACDDVVAQFDFTAVDKTGPSHYPVCQSVLAYGNYPHGDVALDNGDFALLKFNQSDLGMTNGYSSPRPSLLPAPRPMTENTLVTLIQHPLGFPVQFSFCIANKDKSALLVDYPCTTYPGSSGGPLVDLNTGEVVAIHTSGEHEDADPKPCKDQNAPLCAEHLNKGTDVGAIWKRLSPYLR